MTRRHKSENSWLKAAPILLVIVAVAAAVALAGGQGGATWAGQPLMVWCALLAFAVQWVAFVPAYRRQTERFYDLTGSMTYLSVVALALLGTGRFDLRSLLLAGVICVWALRLGLFLFRRVHRDGGDGRFDTIKPHAPTFFIAWTTQGLWVFLTTCAALAAITAGGDVPLGPFDLVGLVVWLAGFSVEVVADQQKSRFRQDPANKGRFIDAGLWSWSRHPNYFGEILLWLGIAICASSTLEGWRWVTLVSPVFVTFLLLRVSGIPLLERRSDDRWGGNVDYEQYKRQTSVLIPLPPRAPSGV